jgi:general secretion pathway protein A
MLQDFGVVSREDIRTGRLAGVTKQDLIETLNDLLLSLLSLNAGAVVVIDEAQNLPLQVLEQVRILSNLETEKEKLLQIVLVGQPNLQTLLRAPEVRQVDQRVSMRYELKALSRQEVAAYVAHRLDVAGGSTAVSFTPRSLELLHRYSGGLPRLINLLCDRALLGGYAARTNRIVPDMVVRAAESLDLHTARPSILSRMRKRFVLGVAGATAAGLVGVAGAGLGYRQALAGPVLAQAEASVVESHAAGGMPMPQRPRLAMPPLRPVPVPSAVEMRQSVPKSARPGAASRPAEVRHQYSILVGSFNDSHRAAVVVDELADMGYRAYQVRLDLGDRGPWTQVLVGEYGGAREALDDESRLRASGRFADAHLVITTMNTGTGR